MTGSAAVRSGSGSISSTLLEQIRAGQADAWERFVGLYGPIVYRWCRRAGLAAEDSADVLQDVLASVAHGLPNYHRDRPGDRFAGWLASITRNKVRDHFRRSQGKAEARGGTTAQRQMAELSQSAAASEASIQPDAESAAWLARQALASIRAEFEERTWTAFWQTTVDARRPADVAAELDMTIAAVYTAKSRVLRRLRKVLGELPE